MTSRPRSLLRITLLALLLGGLNFGLSYSVSAKLYDFDVFHQWDVWFGTDPNYYIKAFSQRPSWFYDRHPTVPLYIAPLVMFAERVLAVFGRHDSNQALVREQIALFIAPLFAAWRSMALFGVFRRLLGIRPAILLCIIDMFSVAAVVGGMVPESFGISATCIAIMYWLAIADAPRRAAFVATAWLAVGTIAVGATVTNMVPFAILLCASMLRRGVPVSLVARNAVLAIALVAAVTASLALAGGTIFGYSTAIALGSGEEQDIAVSSTERATEVAWAFGHTFLAPMPIKEPPPENEPKNPGYNFLFSYALPYQHGAGSLWRGVLTIVMLGAGLVGTVRYGDRITALAVPALIVAFNLAMHQVYGDHFVLYSLHWETSLLVLVSGVALLWRRWFAGELLLGGFAVVTVLNSLWLLRGLFHELATAPIF